jgi:hypothetical protein
MMFLSYDGNDKSEETKQGIVGGHIYALLQTFEFEKDGNPVRLIKLRNPWGHGGEFTGDWSD